MKYFYTRKKQQTQGFTLIEALISVTIFVIVMTIAVGALVTIIDSNRKSQSMQLAVNNVNAAVDHMSWQIRGGTDYVCVDAGGDEVAASSCTADTPQPGIQFEDRNGFIYRYLLEEGKIQRKIDREGDIETAYITSDSTSSPVIVTNLRFSLFGDDVTGTQPAVTIIVQGEAGAGNTQSDFNIQTSVSERFNLVYDGPSNASEFLECPFVEEGNRTIIDIVNIKGEDYTVRADHNYYNGRRSVSGPEIIPPELRLEPGRYRVSAATFDENNDVQGKEVAYFGLLNEAESLKSEHNGEMFVYTGVTEDIPHIPEWGDCDYDVDSTCWRSWYGVINENLEIDETAYAIKVFHGFTPWETFLYPYDEDNSAHTESAGKDRAENYFKHLRSRITSVEYIRDNSWEVCGVSEGDLSPYGCAQSFVPLCLAFDNLDVTTEFEIEDF